MNSIKEILTDVVTQIQSEINNKPLSFAIGRAEISHKGIPNKKTFWIFDSMYRSGYGPMNEQRHIHDQEVGQHVTKNSKIGEIIISRKDGFLVTERANYEIKFFNLTTYERIVHPKIDALNCRIDISGNKPFFLDSALSLLNSLTNDIKKEDTPGIIFTEHDLESAEQISREMALREKEYLLSASAASRYVRENTRLRMNRILDQIQDKVRRDKILSGTMVLDGGPGTGKTSTLIQRIKFLIDDTIGQYDERAGRILPQLQGSGGWIFFSPSPLLAGFLRDAMVSEGLLANNDTVKVWSSFIRTELLRNYRIIGENNSFTISKDAQCEFIPNNAKLIKFLIKRYVDTLIDGVSGEYQSIMADLKNTRLYNNDQSDYELKTKMRHRVMIESDSIANSRSISQLFSRCENLKLNIPEQFTPWEAQVNDRYTKNCGLVISRIERAEHDYSIIRDYVEAQLNGRIEEDEDESDEESAAAQVHQQDIVQSIRRYIKAGISHTIKKRYVPNYKIPKAYKTTIEIINQYYSEIFPADLPSEWFVTQRIRLSLSGGSDRIFSKMLSIYRRYRYRVPEILKEEGFDEHAEKIEEYQKNRENRSRLHYDEMNLLILFINHIICELMKRGNLNAQNHSHHFVISYLEKRRFIIAIDEATDFSLLELACMRSFAHHEYESVSISGDMMQRMTGNGLTNWEEYTDYEPNTSIFRLNISYRQSPTLISLAKLLYFKTTGNHADYNTFRRKTNNEPKPEFYNLVGREAKINWLSLKIMKIYSDYDGNVPSIAIFTPNSQSARELAHDLNEIGELAQMGIDVRSINADNAIQANGTVGVYDIRLIKGMEFEAVFIIDLDEITMGDENLMMRYIYVGITRSANYLFVTYKFEKPQIVHWLSQ